MHFQAEVADAILFCSLPDIFNLVNHAKVGISPGSQSPLDNESTFYSRSHPFQRMIIVVHDALFLLQIIAELVCSHMG